MKSNILLPVLALGILLFSCRNNKVNDNQTTANKKNKVFQVAVKTVTTQPFSNFIEVQGRVDGDENVAVNTQMIGVVTKIYVKEGDAVKEGQVLAELDANVLKQTLAGLDTTLNFLTELYTKQKNLWDKKIGSEIQYLTAKNSKETIEAQIKTIKQQLEMTKLKSPIAGTVEDIAIKVGQAVSPGLPLIRVINFSRTKVIADVSEGFSARIKRNDEVLIHFTDINFDVTAKIDFASKYINPVNRTFSVIAYIYDKSIEYRANMIAVMKIKDYYNPQAIVLPINYILTDHKGKYVFTIVKTNNRTIAKKLYIKTGQTYNGIAEITEGLNAGDTIISTGFENLEEGDEVELKTINE